MSNPHEVKNCSGSYCKHVMHSRCTECGKEQYAPAVFVISHGGTPCVWCGKYNPVMVAEKRKS